MAIRSAKGATVEDVDGNIYIDFFAGAGVMAVGHSNPTILDVVQRQISLLTHALDFPNPARHTLVAKLMEVLPRRGMRLLFGGPTGSDAVEAAIKIAKLNTNRSPIIAFEGGYHGMTSGALSLSSGCSFKEGLLPLLGEIHFLPYAYCYRCPFNRQPTSCDLECAQYFEHVIEDPHSGICTPAAVIVEPIQGEGGSIVPHEEFLPRIRNICDKYDIVLVLDEIQAGLCRTGKMFSCQHTDTLPDIMVMSKALGGLGFPISAIAYDEALDSLSPGKHIGTFRGNVIAYAAGAATLEYMQENRLAAHAAEIGARMLKLLEEARDEYEIVGDVRGRGLMLGVELVESKETKKPAPKLARQVRTECHQRGLLVEVGGHYSNVVRFLPPLVVTKELAQKGVQIFIDSVEEVAAQAKQKR